MRFLTSSFSHSANYEVSHHADFLQFLLAKGDLKPKTMNNATITFHDSCYIGRGNGKPDFSKVLGTDDIVKGSVDIPGVKNPGEGNTLTVDAWVTDAAGNTERAAAQSATASSHSA